MALGSPLGLHWGGATSTHIDHPHNIEKLIGWWDFTDLSTVYTGSIGSLSLAGLNDPIKQITNKANSGTDNLGTFLRTDGVGGSSNSDNLVKFTAVNGVVKFYCLRDDNASTSDAMFATSRVDGWGGVVNGNALGTSGTFSTSTINNHNLTIFFVIDSLFTNVDGSAQGDHFLGISGDVAGYSDTGPPYWPGFRVTASKSGDDWQWNTPNLDASANPETTTLDTNVQLTTNLEVWTIENDSGTNGTKMYRNFDTSDGSTTTITNSGSDSGQDFDMEDGWFSLGAYSLDKFHSGFYADAFLNVRIFEVLIYNKSLTTSEKQSIETYFTNKYNL